VLTELTFPSAGIDCHAWHFAAAHSELASPAGRPIVVMAHGFGATKDSGLRSFAEQLAAAGMDVLAFDYRGFGESGGQPRQVVNMRAQAEDYRAAMTAAASLPGVDPQRLVLWGVSMSGGTVLEVANGRHDVAAVVALTPLVSGLAAARSAPPAPVSEAVRTLARVTRDKTASIRGRAPVMMRIVGEPGEIAALTYEGMYEEYVSIAGPTWRNEVGASIAFEVFGRRTGRNVADLRAPVLVQVADFDRCAPAHAAMQVAVKAHAQVRHYPCDHFGVYAGKKWHAHVVAHQVAFLTQTLRAVNSERATQTR
jgi:pimeloyl-ACP methyl ester carboxylesterase